MKKFLTIRSIVIWICALILVTALHYTLPQVDVVRAVGVEIKRVDMTNSETDQQRTRDVYQLQMETPNGQPRVYRNEDNFLYFKFNSADLQARVQSLAAEKQLVAVRHYGWRLTLFSTFPNALKVWPVEEGYRHIPVFNTLVLLILGGLAFLGFRRARRISRSREESRQLRETERAERDAAAARDAEAAALRSREAEQKSRAGVDDFLNTNGDKND